MILKSIESSNRPQNCSPGSGVVSDIVVGKYFMWNFLAVTVKDSDIVVILEWIGGDYHDFSIEVVQVMD